MKLVEKFKKKAADGTVSKIAVATLLLFNLAYFISLSISQAGKKVDFNFFKDLIDPRTYFYIIVSSIISAVLVSSFIFHKVKAKHINYYDEKAEKIVEDRIGEVEKITMELENNDIMPNKNVIEILTLYCNTADQKSEENNKPFKKVRFIGSSFWSNKNKSVYCNTEDIGEMLEAISKSSIDFFSYNDFLEYTEMGFTPKYENNTVIFKNNQNNEIIGYDQHSSITIEPTMSYTFFDLYNLKSCKYYYKDGSSIKVKFELKKEELTDRRTYEELLDYVNANRLHPQGDIEEPQVAFIPAIAGNRPIFDGKVL